MNIASECKLEIAPAPAAPPGPSAVVPRLTVAQGLVEPPRNWLQKFLDALMRTLSVPHV